MQTFQDWSAYTATGSPKVCFVVSQPKQQLPKNVKRDPAYFYISRWPGDNVVNEISVKMGYPLNESAPVTVRIGGSKFDLFTKGEGAFVEKPQAETDLVTAMRKGSAMKVEGKSTRGTSTSDSYSLLGISDALDRIAKECSS